MTESDPGERDAARERQSYVRHELRAPLAVMFPALSMLLDGSAGDLSPKQREYLEILERNAARLERRLAGGGEALDWSGLLGREDQRLVGVLVEEREPAAIELVRLRLGS